MNVQASFIPRPFKGHSLPCESMVNRPEKGGIFLYKNVVMF